MNQQRIRRPEISVLNVLFCLIVIFIHIISYPVSEIPVKTLGYNAAMIPWRLASFVVQGFIMLSGVKLFLNGKDKLPYGKYLAARLKGIVLPYIVCFAVYYIRNVIVLDYVFDVRYIIKSLLCGELACHFYFIVIIVQFDLLFPLWKKVISGCSPLIALPFALAFMVFMEAAFQPILKTVFPQFDFIYNDRLFTTYVLYWLVGCYIGRYYDEFRELLKKNFGAICIICGFSTALMLILSYIAYNGIGWVPDVNIVHGMYVLSVCLLLYAVAFKVSQPLYKNMKLIPMLDKASFYIYLYHILVLFWADRFVKLWGGSSHVTAFVIRGLVVYIITPLLCIAYIKLKKLCSNQKAQLRIKAQER